MGKPTICLGEKKAQISFAVPAKLISAFVFSTLIVQFLFYLNPKFQASSSFLCLYSSVCVRPVRKPHCWFPHEVAQLLTALISESRDLATATRLCHRAKYMVYSPQYQEAMYPCGHVKNVKGDVKPPLYSSKLTNNDCMLH